MVLLVGFPFPSSLLSSPFPSLWPGRCWGRGWGGGRGAEMAPIWVETFYCFSMLSFEIRLQGLNAFQMPVYLSALGIKLGICWKSKKKSPQPKGAHFTLCPIFKVGPSIPVLSNSRFMQHVSVSGRLITRSISPMIAIATNQKSVSQLGAKWQVTYISLWEEKRSKCQLNVPVTVKPSHSLIGQREFDIGDIWAHNLWIKSSNALPTELRGHYGN